MSFLIFHVLPGISYQYKETFLSFTGKIGFHKKLKALFNVMLLTLLTHV